ncbi:hypothetical protein [Natronosalvus rutilus]|uniref:DUF8048 domain-containing protein n=1 Tax=Natronosalvus rutilus TaxID=2953753 RepID=A0A9E7SUR0_9EURY|nr:hypothetical protein [Natronosalvus rutilus]UTF53725.1 hypothetical protein NGM29_00065 [Natronosalvus rutilus]
MTDAGEPIEGQILLLAAAKASVAPSQLPDLVDRVQHYLVADIERHRRSAECPYEDDDRIVLLFETGFWERIGSTLALEEREWDAVSRAHAEQFRRIGRRRDREAEFETALEIREPVCIGRPTADERDKTG